MAATDRRISALLTLLTLFVTVPVTRAYTLQYRDNTGLVARRWLTKPIIVAFSSSLYAPPANIKAGSDVIGAARRALQHWVSVSDVQFFETTSSTQTISPANAGDRVNLITVAGDNASSFASSDNPGRTRLFYDSGGAIVEGDIALNPAVEFSTDGTPGTYDLESTFTHEVGHLLGLEHSAILGATMQPHQAMNGLYGLPAITQRSLAEDDIAGARALYGSRTGTGSISGRLIARSFAGQSRPIFGGHVFAEEVSTGRVVAGNVTLQSGDYRIDGLEPGRYRLISQIVDGPVTADEIASATGTYSGLLETTPPFETTVATRRSSRIISIGADTSTSVGFFVTANNEISVKPRLIGMNGELSTMALPLKAGKTFTIYIGGEGVDQLAAENIATSSPFISVDRETMADENFDVPYPVISFQVTIAPQAPAGDYSLVLRAADGELIYVVGALTIDRTASPLTAGAD